MKIVLFGNGKVAFQAAQWFREHDEEIVALVLHPATSRRMGDEIIAASGLPTDRIFDASMLRSPETVAAIKGLDPDIGISVFFGYILKRELLDVFPKRCLNVHPALLPFNRGAYPNVWSIVDETPAGVTIHYVDDGIDTGDIVAQREVAIEPVDTGETLYRKLEEQSMKLLCKAWPDLVKGRAESRPQLTSQGSIHRLKDIAAIDEIDLEKRYKARDLLNVLRARTFPPHRGAYFIQDGRKVLIEVHLRYDEPFE